MEVSNRIIRQISINNGSWFNNKDFSSMPCSCVSGFREKNTFSLQSRKQHKTVAICKPTREMNFELFSGCRVSKQNGIPIPLRNASSCFQKPCQVKREDSEGTLSSESIILDEQTLEQELQAAIQEENYSQAAKIRDNLKLLHEDSKAAVLAANTRFYNSFRNGDLAAMQALWSKSENACVVHPGVSGISGYELVMGSWEYVWADYEFPLSIQVKDVQVHVRGDMGYVRCVEMVRTGGKSWGKQFATNVFEKIDGRWFICVHHASHVDCEV
ncbi:putative UVR domain, NTF2-like domain superfamily, SnoaL-like domain-containing protein [Helianthus debilis subsp. tardiflorus]